MLINVNGKLLPYFYLLTHLKYLQKLIENITHLKKVPKIYKYSNWTIREMGAKLLQKKIKKNRPTPDNDANS